jgi:hypothetical protein
MNCSFFGDFYIPEYLKIIKINQDIRYEIHKPGCDDKYKVRER